MKQRYQRGPAAKYRCLCGNQAVKWLNGGYACKRCIEIEKDYHLSRAFSGVRATHETNWAAETV